MASLPGPPLAHRRMMRRGLVVLLVFAALVLVRNLAVQGLAAHAARRLVGATGPAAARSAAGSLSLLAWLAPSSPALHYLSALAASLEGDQDRTVAALAAFSGVQSDGTGFALGALARAARGDPLPDPALLAPGTAGAEEMVLLGLVALAAGDARRAGAWLDATRGLGEHSFMHQMLAGLVAASRGERSSARTALARAVKLRERRPPPGGVGIEVPVFSTESEGASARLVVRPWTQRFAPGARMARAATVSLLAVLAGLEREAGEHARSIAWADLTLRRFGPEAEAMGLSRNLSHLAYPIHHRSQVVEFAAVHGVDPLLVLAVVREESHFDPTAVSRAGATGLMQLMPRTAGWVAERLGRPPLAEDALFHPGLNIDLGCAYLAHLLEALGRTEASLPWVLAAYNGGIANVRRWMERRLPLREAIEFPETRRYVDRVTLAYERYRRLYTHQFAIGSTAGRPDP